MILTSTNKPKLTKRQRRAQINKAKILKSKIEKIILEHPDEIPSCIYRDSNYLN